MKVTKAMKSVRKTWGEISPITKVIPSKKNRYSRKMKHRRDFEAN